MRIFCYGRNGLMERRSCWCSRWSRRAVCTDVMKGVVRFPSRYAAVLSVGKDPEARSNEDPTEGIEK